MCGGWWWRVVREAALDALAVLMPVDCAGCGAADRSLCDECRRALGGPAWQRVVDGVPVFAALAYESSVRRSILSLKQSGRTDVARALSGPLAQLVGRVVGELAARGRGSAQRLVTVPPTFAARRSRGFDPVTVLLARAGLRAPRVLRRARRSRAQKALSQAERAVNRAGSLEVRRPLKGARFVFVDDVVTSGATAREVIRAVREGGGDVVAVVALAATGRVDGRENSRWSPVPPGPLDLLGD